MSDTVKEEPINCEILKEYLDMEKEMGINYKDATKEQIDKQVPAAHQFRFTACGEKNARRCQRVECPSHLGRNA